MAGAGRTWRTWRKLNGITATRLRLTGEAHLRVLLWGRRVASQRLSFCSSEYQRVDFVTMTMEFMPVRRLSTVSWVKRPPHYSLTTQWLWYCRAERGGWLEYGQPVSRPDVLDRLGRS